MPNTRWDEYWSKWTWPIELESTEVLARKLLGVSQTASVHEIKTAYRSLARRFHPDTDPSDKTLAARFKVIAEAYEILTSDRNLRSRRIISLHPSNDTSEEPPPYPQWWLDHFGEMF